ncbi:MAG: hypothetical protein C5B59_19175 [Bacteroidetes bacterium]|nr:MAG: hypothetical protein C5B59_19175 [Bacteroidota bacterium]
MDKILWLCSWYPNKKFPFEGDFIQRHAQAVAMQMPITVIYVSQYGEKVQVEENKTEKRKNGNLLEIIAYFKFKKGGLSYLDKIRYNHSFFTLYKKLIKEYIDENGLPSLVHVHIPMKAGIIAKWINKRWSIPYVLSEHSSAYYESIPGNYFTRNLYYRKSVSSIFKHAKAVTTVSQKLMDRLSSLFLCNHPTVINNVVDTDLFYFRESHPPRFRFFHASTMEHPKNVEGILRVLSQLKSIRTDWECIMAGWETPELRQLSSELKLDSFIQWKGVISYAKVAAEMQQSSALLMFSRYENSPCVIAEALCCGVPVIATRVGGIPELVQAENGFLVESENDEQLLEALIRMMERYFDFDRSSIAETANSKFNFDLIGKKFISLYEQISAPSQRCK